MRNLILLALLLIGFHCGAQVVVDPTVVIRYNKTAENLSSEEKMISADNKLTTGFALFSISTIDTLNKKDKILRGGAITIRDVDIKTGKVSDKWSSMKNESMNIDLFSGSLNGNILTLALGGPYPPYTVFNISGTSVNGYYNEYSKYDTVFRLRPLGHKTNNLNVSLTTSIVKLNTMKFKPGEVLYGEVTVTTAPYLVDDADFKTGYLEKRRRAQFVFKVIIGKD